MTITATIIKDSISEAGVRLTTFQLRYPRFIHAEELTHRVLESQPECLFFESVPDGFMYDQDLSRNASSSRAIPVLRMIEDLRRDPAIPVYWGSHKPGMQAGEEIDAPVPWFNEYGDGVWLDPQQAWLAGMEQNIKLALAYVQAGYHKQIVNRLLEPWAHINVIVTATNYANFFALRSHPDAQPEIKVLSDLMQVAMELSTPELLTKDMWHLPYVREQDFQAIRDSITANGVLRVVPTAEQIMQRALYVSVARCARVSYLTHDGRETTVEEDVALAEKLIVATPLHASPAEHQATPDRLIPDAYSDQRWEEEGMHGNLTGWKQYRKMLPNEYVSG